MARSRSSERVIGYASGHPCAKKRHTCACRGQGHARTCSNFNRGLDGRRYRAVRRSAGGVASRGRRTKSDVRFLIWRRIRFVNFDDLCIHNDLCTTQETAYPNLRTAIRLNQMIIWHPGLYTNLHKTTALILKRLLQSSSVSI